MEVFDAPDPLMSCARRESSTHAPQALELLNGDLTQSDGGAPWPRGSQKEAGKRSASSRSIWPIGWPPAAADREREAARARFLKKQPLREFALAVFNLNDFLYVD